MRILLVEDDSRTSQFVAKGLTSAGHTVDVLTDGHDALGMGLREEYDVAVVDRLLPGLDGLALVRSLRAAGCKMPILFLTALGGVDDRVQGLEAGADDYLVKPFAFSSSRHASMRWRGVRPSPVKRRGCRSQILSSISSAGWRGAPVSRSRSCRANFRCWSC